MRTRNTLLTLSLLIFLVTFVLPETAKGQGLELSGGWAHLTGDLEQMASTLEPRGGSPSE